VISLDREVTNTAYWFSTLSEPAKLRRVPDEIDRGDAAGDGREPDDDRRPARNGYHHRAPPFAITGRAVRAKRTSVDWIWRVTAPHRGRAAGPGSGAAAVGPERDAWVKHPQQRDR
jgi:hypothetical protein